ncbi:MAG: hypothetical protein R3B41_02860 [Candidatus Doudnabacteria bacterium]
MTSKCNSKPATEIVEQLLAATETREIIWQRGPKSGLPTDLSLPKKEFQSQSGLMGEMGNKQFAVVEYIEKMVYPVGDPDPSPSYQFEGKRLYRLFEKSKKRYALILEQKGKTCLLSELDSAGYCQIHDIDKKNQEKEQERKNKADRRQKFLEDPDCWDLVRKEIPEEPRINDALSAQVLKATNDGLITWDRYSRFRNTFQVLDPYDRWKKANVERLIFKTEFQNKALYLFVEEVDRPLDDTVYFIQLGEHELFNEQVISEGGYVGENHLGDENLIQLAMQFMIKKR